jgi:RecJ-like exonuclease
MSYNQEQIDQLVNRAKNIANILNELHFIRVIAHYDADGITAAAIFAQALRRAGKSVHITFVKQLDQSHIKMLENESAIAFLDLGSSQICDIQNLKSKIIIADHHQPALCPKNQNIYHLNPIDIGISENIAGSGVAYLIARALSPANKDLAVLAIIGAIGDAQIGSVGPEWGLFGLNKEILQDAIDTDTIEVRKGLRIWGRRTRPLYKALAYSIDPYIPQISGSEWAAIEFLKELGIEPKTDQGWRTLSDLSFEEQQILATGIIKQRIREGHINPEWIFGDIYILKGRSFDSAHEMATILNATGKCGSPWLGFALCMGSEPDEKVWAIFDQYRKEIRKGLSWINSNSQAVKKTEFANYILAGSAISEHVISNITSIIFRSNTDKPIFAFVSTDDGKVKISARAHNINIRDIVVQAACQVGGEGGGHARACGAIIPAGKEQSFIEVAEKLLSNLNKS